MKSTSLRRAALAAFALAPVLTACGFNVQTDQVYQPAEGVLNRDGDVDVINALIVSGEDGSGTLVASLVNNLDQDDRLTGVTGPDVTVAEKVFADPKSEVVVAADGALNLATQGKITVIGDAVVAGDFVELTLTFASGQSTKVRVPVVRRDGDYAEVPVPAPTGKATPEGAAAEEPAEESAH